MLMGFVGLTVVCAILLGALLYSQRSLVYAPRRYTAEEEQQVLAKYQVPPGSAITLVAQDKTRLRAYWLPAAPDGDPDETTAASVPTVLYLHVRCVEDRMGTNGCCCRRAG